MQPASFRRIGKVYLIYKTITIPLIQLFKRQYIVSAFLFFEIGDSIKKSSVKKMT